MNKLSYEVAKEAIIRWAQNADRASNIDDLDHILDVCISARYMVCAPDPNSSILFSALVLLCNDILAKKIDLE